MQFEIPGLEGLGSARAAVVPTDRELLPRAENIAQFWAKVVITPDCWFWTGAISDGYGRVTFQSGNMQRTMHAHLFALMISGAPMTDGQIGEHACNETICVRVDPNHLHPGTQDRNIQYAVALGRHRGPRPGAVDPRGTAGAGCGDSQCTHR
ncbi:hypothetical protein [Nocardia asiatica]|uniref:hypothetical protein n=1 Tax=Nocardia asiatica TaxID=209252 RepID=UPI002453FF55|nr:hypothetical protein [Nocardia asiatica]